jgi:type II secretory ATPase GspE/PulE/Tfp pilus assembly ATPase PilB-like protein
MGPTGYAVRRQLSGLLVQRLVQRVCPDCSEARPQDAWTALLAQRLPEGANLRQGSGCAVCGFTGYRGLVPVAGLWVRQEEDDSTILSREPQSNPAWPLARRVSLMDDALRRLASGETTPEELARVFAPWEIGFDVQALPAQPGSGEVSRAA